MNDAQLNSIKNDLRRLFYENDDFVSLKNKKVFITGASGYIGKWLLLSFAYLNNVKNYNIEVIATSKNILDCDIIKYLDINGKFYFENVDVRNPFDIPSDVNYVIHLAGSPDRRLYASDPLGVISTNIDGTRNVLNAATRVESLDKILVFTSGHTHGKIDHVSKEYQASSCLSFAASYTESKKVSETLCHIYERQHQLPIGIVRPYSFIGPLQKLDRPWAINNFINGALLNRRIKVIGNPDTRRTFLYSTDMIHAILCYLISTNSELPLELGGDEKINLQELAESIAINVGDDVVIEYYDKNKETARHDFYPKDNKNCNLRINGIDSAIEKTINWFSM